MGKILIVDDEVSTRLLIKKAVESIGHSAVQSHNGKNACDTLFNNEDIVLMVTDMMMPEMGGDELVKVVRGNDKFSDIPIIMISGIVGPKDIFDLLKLGATAFLPKPINVPEIQEYIKRYID